MPNSEGPTNAQLYHKLGQLHADVLATKGQAEKTNGRVNKLERWQIGIDIYLQQIKEQLSKILNKPKVEINQEIQKQFVQRRWYDNDKLVGGIVAVLLAFATAIGFFAGGA